MNLQYKKPIDAQLINKLTNYIKLTAKYLSKTGLSKIMAGIFEPNSLVAAALLKRVLGENCLGMIFDFGTGHTDNLIAFCNKLALNSYILKRGAAYQAEVAVYGKNPAHYKRFINYHLLIQAEQMKAALVDIADKSDRLLGTRPQGFYGHFMPFYSLYKSEVSDLATLLEISIEKDQTYQDLTYDKIDPLLYLLTEKQLSPEEISEKYNLDLHWLKRLKSHVDKQLFQTTVSQFII